MKNLKLKLFVILSFLTIIASIQPVLASTQYEVRVGARFRWDATYYYYNTLGPPAINLNYYLAFNFTNWAGTSGAEYPEGMVDSNGTVFAGEIAHAYYYSGQSQAWVTDILDNQGPYPIHIYLLCNTEIEQTTLPDLQDLDQNSWISLTIPSTYNYHLDGVYDDVTYTSTYTGRIEFNSDKVLKYVKDEIVTNSKTGGGTTTERYIWTLTYTPGTGPGSGGAIPGYSLFVLIGAMAIGFLMILRKVKMNSIKPN